MLYLWIVVIIKVDIKEFFHERYHYNYYKQQPMDPNLQIFGLIKTSSNKDLFFHVSELLDKDQKPQINDEVEFEIVYDERHQRDKAARITYLPKDTIKPKEISKKRYSGIVHQERTSTKPALISYDNNLLIEVKKDSASNSNNDDILLNGDKVLFCIEKSNINISHKKAVQVIVTSEANRTHKGRIKRFTSVSKNAYGIIEFQDRKTSQLKEIKFYKRSWFNDDLKILTMLPVEFNVIERIHGGYHSRNIDNDYEYYKSRINTIEYEAVRVRPTVHPDALTQQIIVKSKTAMKNNNINNNVNNVESNGISRTRRLLGSYNQMEKDRNINHNDNINGNIGNNNNNFDRKGRKPPRPHSSIERHMDRDRNRDRNRDRDMQPKMRSSKPPITNQNSLSLLKSQLNNMELNSNNEYRRNNNRGRNKKNMNNNNNFNSNSFNDNDFNNNRPVKKGGNKINVRVYGINNRNNMNRSNDMDSKRDDRLKMKKNDNKNRIKNNNNIRNSNDNTPGNTTTNMENLIEIEGTISLPLNYNNEIGKIEYEYNKKRYEIEFNSDKRANWQRNIFYRFNDKVRMFFSIHNKKKRELSYVVLLDPMYKRGYHGFLYMRNDKFYLECPSINTAYIELNPLTCIDKKTQKQLLKPYKLLNHWFVFDIDKYNVKTNYSNNIFATRIRQIRVSNKWYNGTIIAVPPVNEAHNAVIFGYGKIRYKYGVIRFANAFLDDKKYAPKTGDKVTFKVQKFITSVYDDIDDSACYINKI